MSKASKWRLCPALGRDISPADCGEQRQSRLACPVDCPHNPFAPANYSQLLEMENRLAAKSADQLIALTPDQATFKQDLTTAERRGVDAINAFFTWRLFFAEGTDKLTIARRWEKNGCTGLKNDERVLLRGKMQMRVALLEVHRVLDGGRVEVVDLLSPEPVPIILQEYSLAGIATRFSTFLSWLFPLPHYWRLSGTAIIIPHLTQFPASEIVREIVRHHGGPLAEMEMRLWLAEHFMRFGDALEAVSRLRRRQMFATFDAKLGKAVYELRATFAQCRQWLDTLPDVEPSTLFDGEKNEGFVEARDWLDSPPEIKQLTAPNGQMVLGRVLLGLSQWRVEACGGEKLARLRLQFEQHLGERVRFRAERVDDLGARFAAKVSAVDESLAPPCLLENPDRLVIGTSRISSPSGTTLVETEQEMSRAADRVFLEERIPALDHRTPREAARDPALRPILIEMMKQRVRTHDEHYLETGYSEDINWLLQELELNEIIFDPPPWRPPPPPEPEDANECSEPNEFDEPVEPAPHRPPAPLLPTSPLNIEEAVRRFENALGLFESVAEAEEELYASGATILDDAEMLTQDALSESDFCFAIPFLLQAWFALVPRGCRAPEIHFDDLETAFTINLRQLQTCAEARTSKKLESFFKSGPQPELMLVLLSAFFEAATTAPKNIQPRLEAQPAILALMKSVVEQVDQVLRRQ